MPEAQNLMRGRTALVTGASRGIGAATASLLADHGAAVAVNYLNSADAAGAVVRGITERGGKAVALKADATDEAQVRAMFAQAEAALGPVDTLVINANAHFKVAPFTQQSWADFEGKWAAELKGAFFACQAALPGMLARGGGCVVAVSSGLARHPGEGFSAHTAAKAGLEGLMKSLALEMGPRGVRVNVVSPGLILTDATGFLPEAAKTASAQRTPLRRNGRPEDVARAILALASDLGGFVNGATLTVNGGAMML